MHSVRRQTQGAVVMQVHDELMLEVEDASLPEVRSPWPRFHAITLAFHFTSESICPA